MENEEKKANFIFTFNEDEKTKDTLLEIRSNYLDEPILLSAPANSGNLNLMKHLRNLSLLITSAYDLGQQGIPLEITETTQILPTQE
jgi:hypothetical protein